MALHSNGPLVSLDRRRLEASFHIVGVDIPFFSRCESKNGHDGVDVIPIFLFKPCTCFFCRYAKPENSCERGGRIALKWDCIDGGKGVGRGGCTAEATKKVNEVSFHTIWMNGTLIKLLPFSLISRPRFFEKLIKDFCILVFTGNELCSFSGGSLEGGKILFFARGGLFHIRTGKGKKKSDYSTWMENMYLNPPLPSPTDHQR